MTKQAVGIVRVSRTKGDDVVSPAEQRKRIEEWCEHDGTELVQVFEELDVSGGASLAKRPGLSQAVSMIENGQANMLIGAYFDRLYRSVKVQAEVTERVEAANGVVYTLDLGETNGSATKRLTAGLMGQIAQYLRETTAERTEEAKRQAIADGVPPFDRVPLGYFRPLDPTGARKYARVPVVVQPDEAAAVKAAFAARANEATVAEVMDLLRERGYPQTFTQVQGMLANRIYLGELHFGKFSNESAHEPIIDGDTFRCVQALKVPRGPRPKSERILARLNVLRCQTCGARMVASNGSKYPIYRCPAPPVTECPNKAIITAPKAERLVIAEVKRLLEGMRGQTSSNIDVSAAEKELERAEAELDAAIETFSVLRDRAKAKDKLARLEAARDEAADRLHELRGLSNVTVTVSAEDIDNAPPEILRDLIKATLETVTVAPGRGDDRLTFTTR